ncbi:MAG TPA: glutathione S-transferase N-terminal domain-containing protein [Gammaproteobacteria bacterium]|nr:glutathione S-transferase N-terminal domain-containing protein [Gammaproteobacteria bacterium]
MITRSTQGKGLAVLTLYTYFRSSAAYRVRIAANLKGIRYRPQFVHLLKGEQHLPAYRTLNPQGLVPQVYNARRFGCDLHDFPRIQAIDQHCLALWAFQQAAPENQPDAA